MLKGKQKNLTKKIKVKTPKFALGNIPPKGRRSNGYCNSATENFVLYVNNERGWHEGAVACGENREKLAAYLQSIPVKIDEWADGPVWLEEVMDNFINHLEFVR